MLAQHPEAGGECEFMYSPLKNGQKGKGAIHRMRYIIRPGRSTILLNTDVTGKELELRHSREQNGAAIQDGAHQLLHVPAGKELGPDVRIKGDLCSFLVQGAHRVEDRGPEPVIRHQGAAHDVKEFRGLARGLNGEVRHHRGCAVDMVDELP